MHKYIIAIVIIIVSVLPFTIPYVVCAWLLLLTTCIMFYYLLCFITGSTSASSKNISKCNARGRIKIRARSTKKPKNKRKRERGNRRLESSTVNISSPRKNRSPKKTQPATASQLQINCKEAAQYDTKYYL